VIGHQVETAYERGWAELTNGDLLGIAEESGSDVMITTDKGIRHQPNLTRRRLAIVVINTTDWTRIRKWKAVVVPAILDIQPGSCREVDPCSRAGDRASGGRGPRNSVWAAYAASRDRHVRFSDIKSLILL
jgi:hypothetical protein